MIHVVAIVAALTGLTVAAAWPLRDLLLIGLGIRRAGPTEGSRDG